MKRYGDGKHGILPTAMGQASLGMSTVVLGMLTYYLTTKTGLSGTIVGSILLCSRIFDGVSDLLAGFIIDRCHFKLGKARPFDLFQIPMWIALVLCFAVPEWGHVGKIIYIFIMYNLCQTVCFTFKSVSATVRLKRTFVDEKRATSVALCGVTSAVFSTIAGIVLPILIDNLENQPNGWLIITLGFAVPGILLSLCEFFLAPEMKSDEKTSIEKQASFKEFAGELFRNKYLVMIVVTVLSGTLTMATVGNVGTFFFKFVYGDLTASSLIGMFTLAAYLFMILIPFLTRKFGNRIVMMIAFACMMIGSFAKYANPKNFGLLAVCGVIVTFGTAMSASVSSLLLIDTMRYGKLKTGRENEAVYSAIKGFADKVANGIAPFIVGRILDIGGFDGALEVQNGVANTAILAAYALIPGIIALIGFVTMMFCNMEKDIKKMEAA